MSLIPAFVAGAALFAGAGSAEAQVLSRISGRLEGAGSLFVSSPQSDEFGFGFAGRLDLGVRVAGPLHVHAFGSFMNWPSAGLAGQSTAPGQAALLGAGLGVEPALTSRIKLRAEVDLGVSLNGASSDARFTWGIGVGAWFGLANVFDLGPIIRVGSVLAADSEGGNDGRGSAYFVTFGLAIALHGAEDAPTPVPLDDTLGRPTDASTTQTTFAPAVTAPPLAPPTQVIVTPPAPLIVTTPEPPPVPVPVPVAVPVPTPPAAPTVAAEEETGRHGRHRRRGRHGRGGRSGGRSGGGRSGGHHRRHH